MKWVREQDEIARYRPIDLYVDLILDEKGRKKRKSFLPSHTFFFFCFHPAPQKNYPATTSAGTVFIISAPSKVMMTASQTFPRRLVIGGHDVCDLSPSSNNPAQDVIVSNLVERRRRWKKKKTKREAINNNFWSKNVAWVAEINLTRGGVVASRKILQEDSLCVTLSLLLDCLPPFFFLKRDVPRSKLK